MGKRFVINCAMLFLLAVLFAGKGSYVVAQDSKPNIVYSINKAPQYPIGGITVDPVEGYDDYVLIGVSGLATGDVVSIPGDEITDAVKRYWNHGLFSNVSIEAEKIQNDSVYLRIHLSVRPKVSEINFNGTTKKETSDLEEKIGISKGSQLSPNIIDRAKIVIKKYFDGKGFKNADIEILQRDDINNGGKQIVDINIDKHEKVKVNKIYITGNDNLPRKKFTGGFFTSGLLKKTNEKGFKSLFKAKKFIDEKYVEDKDRIIEKYYELGYRDAVIASDSVKDIGNNLVDVYLNIDEGKRYYVRNINWVGNTIFSSDVLNQKILRDEMKPGSVYNQKYLNKRLSNGGDEDALANQYFNLGYVFNKVVPQEVSVVEDSVDLEITIYEGVQATIDHIKIYGNTQVYEEVVRRELQVKPGDLFSMDAFKETVQEIAQMGHFDPEAINPEPLPNPATNTVDINLGLSPKSNDQVEFSLGYGYYGVTLKLGLKFNNFSMRNLFGKDKHIKGFLPRGDGQQLEISASTNASYYQQYSISFMDPWFGRKRPTSFSVSAFYSRQTDVNSAYYNNAYYNSSYYSMMSGYGGLNNSYYNNYSSYYDPDKYINLFGVSIGWGKRLTWPDNHFYVSANLAYTRYMLQDWDYFIISNGNCNNINLTLQLQRSSVDNLVFPRKGSVVSASVSATPPYSLFDGIDYANLATSTADASYMSDLQKKYRWIEYHKWKFNSKYYVPLSSATKCFVLMSRFDFGVLGYYNRNKKSPFETFYVGGDGMSGYTSSYYTETIGLRGYDNGCLTPSGRDGYAYSRIGAELRYPLMLNNSTNIYALAFVEGGNAWTNINEFNPFKLKRAAGVGVRLMLPMVGLMGIDWGYGFDKVFGSTSCGGSQFHFVLGQEF